MDHRELFLAQDEAEGKSGEELRTSILSLWQIPDSQRRSNMSISSAREMWGEEEGEAEKSVIPSSEKTKNGQNRAGVTTQLSLN